MTLEVVALILVLSLVVVVASIEILVSVHAQKAERIEIREVKEVVVEKPSFVLEGGIIDLDELFVYVITALHESGGVSQDARVAKSWHNLVQRHLDANYPSTLWIAPDPVIWVGCNIPQPLLDHLRLLSEAHQDGVNAILSQEN